MATVVINEERLSAIGDAIRAKTGNNELLRVADMPTAIEGIETGGADLPEEAFNISGLCSYMFYQGKWDWFIETYGKRIKTNNITNAANIFYSSTVTEIPFDLNFNPNATSNIVNQGFAECRKLKKIGKIVNLTPSNMSNFFQNCFNLRELPEFVNFSPSYWRLAGKYDQNLSSLFNGCYSLRRIPPDFMKELWHNYKTTSAQLYFSGFRDCYSIDEIVGVPVTPVELTSNAFSNTFIVNRAKDITFATEEDGQPKVAKWKAQVIDLTNGVGISTGCEQYNSGITKDKRVRNDETYHALKNDPDWYTAELQYSRYNHDSAVNTINSLPDTSAYGTNTIKFKGAAGSATDGGAINTLTEEEIAVAAVKGWTVTFV